MEAGCPVDSMSTPLTGLPWFDDIIWIVASRLVSWPASLKRASSFPCNISSRL